MSCDRFEREFILCLERGLPLPEHAESCVDCIAARKRYAALTEAIGRAGSGLEPPADWQARVWAKVARDERPRRKTAAWLFGGITTAFVAMAIALLLWLRPGALSVNIEVRHGEQTMRGSAVRPGDHLILHARAGRAAHAELRIYRNERELVLQRNLRSTGEEAIDYPVSTIGQYRVLLIASEEELTLAGSSLDEDAGAALKSGARIYTSLPMAVE
jgi:hypothetical protein